MKKVPLLIIFVWLIGGCKTKQSVSRQKSYPAVSNEQKNQLLLHYRQLNQPVAQGKIFKVYWKGTVYYEDKKIPVQFIIRPGNLLKVILYYAGEPETIIDYPAKKYDTLTEALIQKYMHYPLTGLFHAFLETLNPVYKLPDTLLYGKKVSVYKFTDHNTSIIFYRDIKHDIILRQKTLYPGGQKMSINFMDFRKVNEFLLPFRWEWHDSGNKPVKVIWNQVILQ